MAIQMEQLQILDIGRGGANEKIAPHLIGDNQSAAPDSSTYPLKNCHTNEVGKIIKRNGSPVYTGPITISGSPDIVLDEICGGYQYNKFDGNSYEIIVGSNGADQKVVDISTPASPSDITGAVTITDDTYVHFATVADTLIMTTEDRDAPIKWTGSSTCAALGGTPPSGKYVIEFFNYAFIANTSSNPERIYWSALFDVESWTTGSDFFRAPDAITGVAKRGDTLYIFTKNTITIARYTGDAITPFDFQRLDTNVGCISHRSLANIEGVLHWMAGDAHLYRMQDFKPERLTEAIPQTIAGLNQGSFSISCGIDHRELRQYWCAVTNDSSTVNDFVLVLDYLNNELFMYDGMNINSIFNWVDSSGNSKTYFGDRTGRVFLTNSGTSDYPGGIQTAIDFWRWTKKFPLTGPNRKKRLRKVKFTINNGGAYSSQCDVKVDSGALGGGSLEMNHDGGGELLSSTWVLGESALGRISDISKSVDVNLVGKYIQFKFYNNAFSQPVEISDFELHYQSMGIGRN